MFEDFRLWKAGTGENLATLTPHTRETLDYWVHATVPTGDRFAPIGDQSRVSNPEIFDYQRNLMLLGMALSPATAQAGRAAWWLEQIDLQENSQGFVLRPTLLSAAPQPVAPSDLHALLISAVERPLIEVVLERAGGNQVKAAEMLGINRNTLRKKITGLGIEIRRGAAPR